MVLLAGGVAFSLWLQRAILPRISATTPNMCLPTLQVRAVPNYSPPACRPLRLSEDTIVVRPNGGAWIRKRGEPSTYIRSKSCSLGMEAGIEIVDYQRTRHGSDRGSHDRERPHGGRRMPGQDCGCGYRSATSCPPLSIRPCPPPRIPVPQMPTPQMPIPIPQPKPQIPPAIIEILPSARRRRSSSVSTISAHSFREVKRKVRILWERIARIERKEDRIEQDVERGRERERSRARVELLRRIRDREREKEQARVEERRREEAGVRAVVAKEVEKREREMMVERRERERWIREGECREREKECRERETGREGRVGWGRREVRGRWEDCESWRPGRVETS